jgi:Heparinase II/III-like protein/Heparinase II/III N-terminus
MQKLSALAERRGWSSLNSLPSDESFRRLVKFDKESLLERFRSRSQPHFFAGFDSTEKVAAALHSYWSDSESHFLRCSDDAVEGRFDLLGLKQLDFGNPLDWHLEPISGKRSALEHWSLVEEVDAAQSGDKKIVWELNRHQHFVLLGQAYWLTNDERYAKAFASQLSSWIEQNPPKLGINWISSLEIAFRSISWIWSLHFFKHSAALTSDLFWQALRVLYLNARHIETYLSTYFSPNTHLTGEALGLYYLGTIFPEFDDASRWRSAGRRILLEQLPLHVQNDGVYFEQSSYYHRYTTDFYTHFLLLAAANDDSLPDIVGNKLQQLLDHLMYITRPEGTMPLFGDDDGGRLMIFDPREPKNDCRSSLTTGAAIFRRADYKFVAQKPAREILWLLGPDGLERFENIEPAEPRKQSIGFSQGGYYVMRDGWTADANYLLFDCGPHGVSNCGHAHADALAFELATNGRTLLVDPGTFSYTGSSEARNWFRSSPAHNTLTLDSESSSVSAGPFSWTSIAKIECTSWLSRGGFDFVSGRHDGYQRLEAPATHIRSILFVKNRYWVVLDEIESKGNHNADLWFHFDAGANPLIEATEGPEIVLAERGLDITVFGDAGRWRREEGWVSYCYGSREPARVYAYSAQTTGGGRFISFLLPRAERRSYKVREVEAIGGKAFAVTHENGVDIVMIRAGDSEQVEMERLASNFAWTWVRFTDPEGSVPAELIMLNGSRLNIEGRQVLNSGRHVQCLAALRQGNQFIIDTDEQDRGCSLQIENFTNAPVKS